MSKCTNSVARRFAGGPSFLDLRSFCHCHRSGKRVSKIFSRPGCFRAGVAAGSEGEGVAEAPRALGREAECRPRTIGIGGDGDELGFGVQVTDIYADVPSDRVTAELKLIPVAEGEVDLGVSRTVERVSDVGYKLGVRRGADVRIANTDLVLPAQSMSARSVLWITPSALLVSVRRSDQSAAKQKKRFDSRPTQRRA